MALVKCSDCSKYYSDAAVACPGCGRPSSVELVRRYQDDSDLLRKDAQKGDLEAIKTVVQHALQPIGASAKITKTFSSLHIELSGENNQVEEQMCMGRITEAINTIKPKGITVVGASFFHKEGGKRWARYLQLKDGHFVDNTKGAKTNISILAGIALVAFFGGCSAYLNALQNPSTPTIEERMKTISEDKCLMYKIDCPKENLKWSPELNRLIYDGSK